MSFMVSEEVTVKEGGPRMIVTGYTPAVWLSVVGMTVTGSSGKLFMKPSLFRGRGVVLRKKFERVSLTPGRMWRSRRIRSGVPVSALNCLMRRYRVLSCLRYKTKLSMSVASYHCHHYKIIAVLRYAIARLCQNHKKAGWESSGCSTRQKWKTRAG